jgi:hypothetical protein
MSGRLNTSIASVLGPNAWSSNVGDAAKIAAWSSVATVRPIQDHR